MNLFSWCFLGPVCVVATSSGNALGSNPKASWNGVKPVAIDSELLIANSAIGTLSVQLVPLSSVSFPRIRLTIFTVLSACPLDCCLLAVVRCCSMPSCCNTVAQVFAVNLLSRSDTMSFGNP